MSKHYYTFLALGDSYTIGESVALHESFPYQVVQLLRSENIAVQAPEIVAKTGWTSFELAEHLLHTRLNEHYDFVTLLIGVNNQYRGLSITDFTGDFDFLLKKAIHWAGEKPSNVMVLSIPDWGMTPFGANSKKGNISSEIHNYNKICEYAAKKYGAGFIEITNDTRRAAEDSALLAADKLHYSGKEHRIWAEKVAKIISLQIRKGQSPA